MNKTSHQLLFWAGTFAALVGLFSQKWNSFSDAFYFAGMLLPVAAGTAYFFIHFLVPRFLYTQQHLRFALYTVYTLLVSAFLMVWVSMISFILLADLKWYEMSPIAKDLFQMALVTYFIAILFSFIRMYATNQGQAIQIEALKEAEQRNRQSVLTIRSNRQNVPIPLAELLYIESLADYVKLHTLNDLHMSKEKISKLEERLPNHFIRIHRSFLVNQHHVERFGGDYVIVAQQELPMGRKFKKEAIVKMKELSS